MEETNKIIAVTAALTRAEILLGSFRDVILQPTWENVLKMDGDEFEIVIRPKLEVREFIEVDETSPA